MTGGGGADTFDYNSVKDAVVALKHDNITDFTHLVDQIDLSTIDANSGKKGNQAFTFLDVVNSGFGGHAGELRFFTSAGATKIEGDTNGDSIADFQITLTGTIALSIGDFIL